MLKKNKGSMFIISAPSGAGKTTLCKMVMDRDRNLRQSVSYTSRGPRQGETDGVDYSFVSEADFREMMIRGEFVEWAEVHGNLYGTSRRRLEELMDSGCDVLLDIDTQGAREIRKTVEGGIYIFILPPSMKVLRERLQGRGSNTPEDMDRRLRAASEEISDYSLYNYVIVNDSLEESLKGLEAIIAAVRLRSDKIDPDWIREEFFS